MFKPTRQISLFLALVMVSSQVSAVAERSTPQHQLPTSTQPPAASTVSSAPALCTRGEDNKMTLSFADKNIRLALTKLKTDSDKLIADAKGLKNWSFESTVAANKPKNTLADLETSLKAQGLKISDALSEALSPSQLGFARDLVAKQFEASTLLLQIYLIQDYRNFKSVEELRHRYTLKLTSTTWLQLNLEYSIPGLEAEHPDRDSAVVLFTPEVIMPLAQKIASVSPQLQKNGDDYFQTLRCLMADNFSQKYLRNQIFLRSTTENSLNWTVADNTKACLNVTAGELVHNIKMRLHEKSEDKFRDQLKGLTFDPKKFMSPQLKVEIGMNSLNNEQIVRLYAFPQDLKIIAPHMSQEDLQTFENETTTVNTAIATAAPYFNVLTQGSASPEYAALIQSITSSCLVTFDDKTLPAALTKLHRAEAMLQWDLRDFIDAYKDQLAGLDDNTMFATLAQLLIYKKYRDLQKLTLLLLKENASDNMPPTDQTLEAIDNELFNIAVSTVQSNVKNGIAAWFQTIVTKADELKKQDTLAEIRKDFYANALSTAKLAAKYADPNTPKEQLPYNPIYLSQTFNDRLATLDYKNNQRFNLILGQKTPDGRPAPEQMQTIWHQVETELLNEAAAKHFSVNPPSWLGSFGQATTNHTPSWLGIGRLLKNSDDETKFREQYTALNLTAQAMGLTMPTVAQNFADVYPYLSAAVNNQKDLDIATERYRQYLIAETTKDMRFLNYHVEPTNLKSQRVYEVLSWLKDGEWAAPTIEWAINWSNAKLARQTQMLFNAKSIKDLEPFILNSTIANDLLADYPEYLRQVQARQAQQIRYANIPTENQDEIAGNIGFAYVGMLGLTMGGPVLGFITRSRAVTGEAVSFAQNFSKPANALYATFLPQAGIDMYIQKTRANLNSVEKPATINDLYWSDAVNYGLPQLIKEDSYNSQTEAFLAAAKAADHQFWWDFGGISVPIAFSVGGAITRAVYAESVAPWMRITTLGRADRLERALSTGTDSQIKSAKATVAGMARSDRRSINAFFRRLGVNDQEFPRIKDLQNARNRRLLDATSTVEKIKIERDYNNAINIIGNRLISVVKKRGFITEYSRVFFGRTDYEDLNALINEYLKINSKSGVGL